MTISIFTAGLEQSHWITRSASAPGPAGQTVLEMGDATKGGGSDARRSTYHSWDLGDTIPKHAIIDEAYIEFVPTAGVGADPDTDDFEHSVALMFADGHWNRSAQNELHQSQGAAYYYAPSQTDTLFFTVRNSSDVEIADTMPVTTGQTWFSNSQASFQGLGCTIEIPANEDLKTVRVQMNRLHAPDPSAPTLKVNAYTLSGNGRQYALDTLVASSGTVAYGSLALNPASSDIDFTFATAIPAQSTARWIGLMIEGEIFDGAWTGTQVYQLRRRAHSVQTAYLAGTAGSWIHADIATDIANANSLVGYLNERSVPCLYPVSSSTPITTPYARYFGSLMTKRECGPWNAGVLKSYGSSAADEEFPDFVQNIQDWIDSDHYSPGLGKTWIGLMVDIASPENIAFPSAGPAHATLAAYELVIDWHPRLSAARSDATAMLRVSAGASRVLGRVSSQADALARVSARTEARMRVRPAQSRALLRVRAPASNARAVARVAAPARTQRVSASQQTTTPRVVATARAGMRVRSAATARPRVSAVVSYAAMRVRAPLSNARSGA